VHCRPLFFRHHVNFAGPCRAKVHNTSVVSLGYAMKPIAACMEEAGMSIDQLVVAAGLDTKLVKAIVSGNYTPSPTQRQRLAGALGVSVGDISWGHTVEVQYLRGNGPQSGRST
jgi:hypothetical protein